MWHCNSVVEDPQWQEEDSNWVLLRDSPSHRLSSVRRTQIDSQNRHQDSCRHGVNYQRDTWFGHIDSRRSWLSYLRRPLLKRAVIPLMLPRHRADGDVLSKGGRTWRTMASCKEVYLDWFKYHRQRQPDQHPLQDSQWIRAVERTAPNLLLRRRNGLLQVISYLMQSIRVRKKNHDQWIGHPETPHS